MNNYSNPFRFIVECTILTPRSVVLVDFQLDLIDVNDHPPRFPRAIYRVNLTEDTPVNSLVSSEITAYDLDSGPNALFFFYLLNDSSPYLVGDAESPSSRSMFLSISAVLSSAERHERQSAARQSLGLQCDGCDV